MSIEKIDIIGKRFGKLVVLSEVNRVKTKWSTLRIFSCVCDCGATKDISMKGLRKKTKSCGCLHKEAVTKHGKSRSPLYCVWSDMKARCNTKTHRLYPLYGGRGIFLCKEWEDSFLNFERDMAVEYKNGLSIERINNNDGYYKENCRWATKKEQARNRRDNKRIKHNGVEMCLSEWADVLSIDRGCLNSRIIYGWSSDKVLTTPSLQQRKK